VCNYHYALDILRVEQIDKILRDEAGHVCLSLLRLCCATVTEHVWDEYAEAALAEECNLTMPVVTRRREPVQKEQSLQPRDTGLVEVVIVQASGGEMRLVTRGFHGRWEGICPRQEHFIDSGLGAFHR
jgi:hypothetical protein